MEYQLIGDVMPAVEVRMQSGEAMYTQSGGMVWMSEGIKMDTNTNGGVLKGFTRKFAGESMFMATYSAPIFLLKIVFNVTLGCAHKNAFFWHIIGPFTISIGIILPGTVEANAIVALSTVAE